MGLSPQHFTGAGERNPLQDFNNAHIWKRRVRNAPSARPTDREERLYVVWNNPAQGENRPRAFMLKDPILWSIWVMKTQWSFVVATHSPVGSTGWTGRGFEPVMNNMVLIQDKKEALAEYKKRVKAFLRSKEIEYEFPVLPNEEPDGKETIQA